MRTFIIQEHGFLLKFTFKLIAEDNELTDDFYGLLLELKVDGDDIEKIGKTNIVTLHKENFFWNATVRAKKKQKEIEAIIKRYIKE